MYVDVLVILHVIVIVFVIPCCSMIVKIKINFLTQL